MGFEQSKDLDVNEAQPQARRNWISACQFHSYSEKEIFDEILKRIVQRMHPIILLDLDSTLYNVSLRTYQILADWNLTEESKNFQLVKQALAQLQVRDIEYSIADIFLKLGLDQREKHIAQAYSVIKKFWLNRFFSNAYLHLDCPYPGAVELTQKFYQAGAHIIYLTGRDEPNMGQGTRENLARDEFPWNSERTRLFMKPASDHPDLEFKRSAVKLVQQAGHVVASFENEPLNLVALYELFPQAMHVFVDTVCSQHEALPCQGLYKISGFQSCIS